MALTQEEVLHIARLARIRLHEDEIDRMAEQLSGILGHFEVLQTLDTESVEPTVYPLPLKNVMRADEVQRSLPTAEVLQNAPSSENGYLRVRAVLE